MGLVMARMWDRLLGRKREFKMLILGLANAGKTTLLYRLRLGQAIVTQPTIGSNVEEVRHDNVRFQAWDLGGQDSLRSYWTSYFLNTHAVIFVIDSTEEDNIEVAKMELFNALTHESLKDVVLLVLANKQDVRGAKDPATICSELGLDRLTSHEWHLQGCCALDGAGLESAMHWMSNRILAKNGLA